MQTPSQVDLPFAPWPLEVLGVVLGYVSRPTLARCARVNSAWYDASVKRLYDHYEVFPTVADRTVPAHLTERKRSNLTRTRHMTVWAHDARLCHSESPPFLPSLQVLSFHSTTVHDGERPFGRRPCSLLRALQPSTIVLHGTDFPASVNEVWELIGAKDVVVSYDPMKSIADFHLIDRWPTSINPRGAPRSLTVVFSPTHDEYIPEERLRFTNLRRLASWVALLPWESRLTVVDVGAGATHESLVTSVASVAWPLSRAWEEGGREGFLNWIKKWFLDEVRNAMLSAQAQAQSQAETDADAEAGMIDSEVNDGEGPTKALDMEARLSNIKFVEKENLMTSDVVGDWFTT